MVRLARPARLNVLFAPIHQIAPNVQMDTTFQEEILAQFALLTVRPAYLPPHALAALTDITSALPLACLAHRPVNCVQIPRLAKVALQVTTLLEMHAPSAIRFAPAAHHPPLLAMAVSLDTTYS